MNNKDRKFTPQYKVTEVARLLNMHPQSVRYYDNIGVVESAGVNEFAQRVYSTYDVFKIMQVKRYQKMGFSLKEITGILEQSTVGGLVRDTQQKMDTLDLEIQKLQQERDATQRFHDQLAMIDIHLNRCFYKERPGYFAMPHVRDGMVIEEEDNINARNLIMNYPIDSDITLILTLEDLMSNANAYSIGSDMVVMADIVETYGLTDLESIRYVEPSMCIYSVCEIGPFEELSKGHVQYILDFIDSNDLVMKGDMLGTIIANISDTTDETKSRFFEIWVPIA